MAIEHSPVVDDELYRCPNVRDRVRSMCSPSCWSADLLIHSTCIFVHLNAAKLKSRNTCVGQSLYPDMIGHDSDLAPELWASLSCRSFLYQQKSGSLTFSMTCWNKHRAVAVWWHLATRCWGDFIQDTSLAPEAVKKKRSLEQLRRIGWALFIGGLCFRKWPWAEDERGQVSKGLLATLQIEPIPCFHKFFSMSTTLYRYQQDINHHKSM